MARRKGRPDVAAFVRFEESFDLWRRRTWKVVAKSQNAALAKIEWKPEWDKFVLCEVNPGAEFDAGCLDEISAFMKRPEGKGKR